MTVKVRIADWYIDIVETLTKLAFLLAWLGLMNPDEARAWCFEMCQKSLVLGHEVHFE